MERMIKPNELALNKPQLRIQQRLHTLATALLLMTSCCAVSVVHADSTSAATPSNVSAQPAAAPSKFDSAMGSTLDWFGFNHTRVDGLHHYYLGVGDTNSLLHLYAEMPTQFGHVYVKAGEFEAGTQIAGQVGFRLPYHYTHSTDNDGVYFGAYAGDIANDGIDGRVNRVGAAAEMSYLFLNKASLIAASVSIGGAKPDKSPGADPDQQKVTPIIMFGLDWGFGAF